MDQLREALQELMTASATRDAQRIGTALRRVIALERELPADTPERLRHFLANRSYQKALAFLEARPACDGA
jgi:hypothetical protein